MSRRTVAIIQARTTSTRLPGKVLKPLAGHPVLVHVIERARRIPGVGAVCVAIPEGRSHEVLANLLAPLTDVAVSRGPEDDVLRRYAIAAAETGAQVVVRLTADCPLFDPAASAVVVAAQQTAGVAYARTAFDRGYPHGFDTEAIESVALLAADREAADPYEREHVTPFLWRRPERFPAVHIDRVPDRRRWRLVLDTEEDYALLSKVFDELYPVDPFFGLGALEDLFRLHPEWLELNAAVPSMRYVGLPEPAR